MTKISFYITLLFLLLIIQAEASTFYGTPGITNYSRQEYKAGTQNWKISQADNELLYFANNDGILEYDGASWTLLLGLKSDMSRSVLAVNDIIYSASNNDFGYYKTNSKGQNIFHSLWDSSRYSELGDFWNIIELNNNIYFQAEKGIVKYNIETKESELLQAHSRITNAFKYKDYIYMQDETIGLMYIENNEIKKAKNGELFSGKFISSILPIKENKALITTIHSGIYVWENDLFRKWVSPSSSLLEKNNVYCATLHNDELFFGTIQSGVIITDLKGKTKTIINKDHGLNNNTILSIFVDLEGNIWAGLDNGIAKITYNSSINFIQKSFDLGTGYAVEIYNDKIYLGTNQGLYHIDLDKFADPLKTKSDFVRISEMSGQVWNLFKDNEGNLLCGHNNGVFQIAPSFKEISPPSIKGGWIFKYPPNRKDILIVGTYEGLILLKKIDGQWIFSKKIDGFNKSSRLIEWDIDGTLWVSHGYQGVFRITFDNDYKNIEIVENLTNTKGLPQNIPFTLNSYKESVFLCSEKGIFYYSEKDSIFKEHLFNSFFSEEEFPLVMKEDIYKNQWYFTRKNIGTLKTLEDGSVKNIKSPFLSIEGKLVNGFEYIYNIDNNNILIGIEDGFAHYLIQNKIFQSKKFNVHIRGFRHTNDSLNNTYFLSSDTQVYIPSWKYKNNSFEVNFSSTSFESDRILFASYLEGLDTDWSAFTLNNQRQFTNLKEGTYTLHTKALNEFGVESKQRAFTFIITPPWYRTIYAKVIYILIVIAFIIGLIYFQKIIIKRSKALALKKQEEKFKIKEEKLRNESILKEKEMIKLRNEKLQSEMIFKEKELANSTMNVIQKNDFLLTIKTELNKLSKQISKKEIKNQVRNIITKIDKDIDNDSQWEIFELHLEEVHSDFLNRLKQLYPDLTTRELKLCAYLRMEMSSKEIANLMNISVRAVENNRYKLRKKLNLSGKDNLIEYILSI